MVKIIVIARDESIEKSVRTLRRMSGETGEGIFNEVRLRCNRVLGGMASIRSSIKRPLTPRQKRLRMGDGNEE